MFGFRFRFRPAIKTYRVMYTCGDGTFYQDVLIEAKDAYAAARSFDTSFDSYYRRRAIEEVI